MTLKDLLQILTIVHLNGVKLFTDMVAVDDNLAYKGSFHGIFELKRYYDNKVFQIIANDFEGYFDIIKSMV